MKVDIKSFILGTIVGGCIIIYRASVEVAKRELKRVRNEKES